MKTLVLYDSNFGNTKLIADEIAKNIGGNIAAISVKDIKSQDIEGLDLLIMGCPINGWRPTDSTLAAIELLKDKLKDGLKYTTFDTRMKIFIHGDAKEQLSRILMKAGGKLIFEPQAFYVSRKKGPLYDGELEKVDSWTKLILSKI